ncbi:hypothetical protein HMPREF0063_10045 [Aeromicrobium marinum DSM 15272]|uniref:Uncharacterized protein n=2 Tax=Aeromicrobium marinum TaxID=219314 RepID=E2S7N8_9ACTN|nr:hypothetical protein HMPREF0063_10045 [Aeromicrobium marinum DSM 15272]
MRGGWAGIAIAVLVIVATAGWWNAYTGQRQEAQQNAAAAVTNADAAQRGTELAEQVIRACAVEDEFGETVREAGLCNDAEDTRDAIEDEVTEPPREGRPGRDGVDGRSATQAQVTVSVARLLPAVLAPALQDLLPAEVAAFCANDACRGQRGLDGTTPSNERLLALIRPLIPEPIPGAPGATGDPGPAGRGIASLQCQDDGRWLVTYTDGAAQDAGPCRVALLEPPAETPEP